MVSPVSGPFSRLEWLNSAPRIDGSVARHYERSIEWYRQAKPYNLPLWLTVRKRRVLHVNADDTHDADVNDGLPFNDDQSNEALNQAYKKFVAKLGDQSLWAVNAAEGQQSLSMIIQRVTQLTRFTKAVNRFDFRGASKALFPEGPKQKFRPSKAASKDAAAAWLEYHFGWEPLVKDIYAGVNTLCDPPSLKRKRVRAKHTHIGTNFVSTMPDPTWTVTDDIYWSTVAISADVRINNPNVFLANQLGLVNPASVVWELASYSFVEDWFFNVGQVLASYTDLVGLDISNAYHTRFQRSVRTRRFYYGFTYAVESVYVLRRLGVPSPVLKLAPWKGFSPIRGLTAVSLLLQHMGR